MVKEAERIKSKFELRTRAHQSGRDWLKDAVPQELNSNQLLVVCWSATVQTFQEQLQSNITMRNNSAQYWYLSFLAACIFVLVKVKKKRKIFHE